MGGGREGEGGEGEQNFAADIIGKEAVSKIYKDPKKNSRKKTTIRKWVMVMSRLFFFFFKERNSMGNKPMKDVQPP